MKNKTFFKVEGVQQMKNKTFFNVKGV